MSVKKYLSLILSILLIFVFVGCDNIKTEQNSEVSQQSGSENSSSENIKNESTTEIISTESSTNAIFDVTAAYKYKPYNDNFAIARVDELQYIDENSLYYLCSSEPTPIFYDDFFDEKSDFDVNLEEYNYNIDNESIRKYFDTYEYSKFANIGAVRVIDSFVYNDVDNDRMLYYCYYTVTHWSEDENLDTLDYYRDLFTVNKKDNSISYQEEIPIKLSVQVPKEISGEHNFNNII